ncbi:androgen-dependent TFPI-regulating protein-like [Amblyraja radiata]|uniref:androgen-dependent TFPI-regulating protein-like n=1 Tax=Amblyraja radiata TaxID=386614 RepID=UPI001404164D|nr:androgen-dependent TFPI-regulating protein-like [Amblyraja radiata]XP_032870918.1 androgen-dependent TFPI-regulating protein-like [Amblyraja radiata]
MASTLLSAVFHITSFGWYLLLVHVLLNTHADHAPTGVFLYAGQWKYLTFLNLFLQMIFNGLCILSDIQKQASWILCLRDLFFSVLVFPVGTFVVASFWILFTLDRSLVYPEALDKFIPLWVNHAVHTMVLPLVLLELFISRHRYPTRRTGLLILGTISISYLLWVLWIYYAAGDWVYPLLGLFNQTGLVAFFSFSLLLVMLLYLLGEQLTLLVWGLTGKTKRS